jgi:DNA-binding NarL/FixJ family response regulator
MSLLEAGGHEIVGQASNGVEAVRLSMEISPELTLMDVHMPEMGGLEALKTIKNQRPKIKVVMLTVSEDDKDLLEAIRSGADGYILKHVNSAEFLRLLENLNKGEAAILPTTATRLFKYVGQSDPKQEASPLSEREIGVLKLMATGKSNRDIARELSVSENTIKFHIKNILQKLSVSNRVEAVSYAIQYELI